MTCGVRRQGHFERVSPITQNTDGCRRRIDTRSCPRAVGVHMLCSTIMRLPLTQRFSVRVGTTTLTTLRVGRDGIVGTNWRSGHSRRRICHQTNNSRGGVYSITVYRRALLSNIFAHVFTLAKWRPDCLCHLIVLWSLLMPTLIRLDEPLPACMTLPLHATRRTLRPPQSISSSKETSLL